jgi:hypothetical protein
MGGLVALEGAKDTPFDEDRPARRWISIDRLAKTVNDHP